MTTQARVGSNANSETQSSTSLGTWMATIIASFVVKYVGDTSLYVPVVKLMEIFFLGEYLGIIGSFVSLNLIYGIIMLCVVGYYYKHFFHEGKGNVPNIIDRLFYNHIALVKTSHKKKVLWYFDANKQFIKTKYNMILSTPEMEFARLSADFEGSNSNNVLSDTIKPEYDKKIYFHDTKYNVRGYFVWRFDAFTHRKKYGGGTSKIDSHTIDHSFHVEHVTLFVSKFSQNNIKYYFDRISDEYTEHIDHETMEKLSYVYLNVEQKKWDNSIRFVINSQSVIYFDSTKNKNQSKIFDSYFHNDKKTLLRLIDSIKPENFNRSEKFQRVPQLGLILHGPPGTGKSDLVRRIGIHLKRHVVVLDILKIPKVKLIEVLRNPWDDNEELGTEKFIFYLDEFDAAIIELKRRETLQKKLEIDKRETYSCGPSDKLTEMLKKNKNDEIERRIMQYEEYITYSELLGILQGLIPLNQIIFIATTNNLDTIKELCSGKPKLFDTVKETKELSDIANCSGKPDSKRTKKNKNSNETHKVDNNGPYNLDNNSCALIRHGRLTPVLCDYFNGKSIKEICKYYFGKVPCIEDDATPGIINTQIMYWVENYYDEPNGYELFMKEIQKYMST